MNKNHLTFVFLIIPLLILSQTNTGTCIWTGDDYGTNTNWTNPSNWTNCGGSYPDGAVVKTKIDGTANATNRTITIDSDVRVNQFSFGGNPSNYTWTFDGSGTLTFGGSVSQPIRFNRGNAHAVFNCNVTVDYNGQKIFYMGSSSNGTNSITFGAGKTLNITQKVLKFTYSLNSHSVIFNGSIVSGSTDANLVFSDIHTATFGSSVDMTGFQGKLLFQGPTAGEYTGGTAGSGITVNGDVKAAQVRLSATDLTVSTTGSLTVTGSGDNAISNGGTGKFIVQTSQSNSGSIVATGDTSGYTLDFVRTLDSDNEITFLGIPVTDESIQDLIDNGNLRTKNGKSFLGYFDNSSGTYSYYDSSGNTGNLGSGTNSGGKSLSAGTGFIISPDGTGSKNITISGTTTSQSTANTFTVYRASGTYGAYQLVGNPFPSYVALNANADGTAANNFLQTNETIIDDSYEQIWAWDGSQWNTYNLTENTVKHIAPGEGFFIRLTSTLGTDTAGSVIFNESMQKNGSFRNFNASASNESQMNNKAVVRIKVTDLETNQSDKVKLYFSDNSTKGLDKGYDGGKFFIKNSAYMYTRLLEGDQGVDMGIQALPYSDLKDVIIPLGVETESSSIEFSFIERDLSDLYNIFLEDRLNNTIVKFDNKLKIDLENKVNGHNRFFLHFTDGLIPELPTDNDLRIFKNSSSNLSIIGNPNQRYKAKIFDYSGRLVKEAEFIHKSNIDELDSRMKILRIESKDGLTVKKFKLN